MGVFLRPKSTNRVNGDSTKLVAEVIGVVQDYENEYIPGDGTFDSNTDGQSGAYHRKDPVRREAEPGAPLPTGGRPAGYTGTGGRSWRGSVSRNVSSGFGKGTRAGNSR